MGVKGNFSHQRLIGETKDEMGSEVVVVAVDSSNEIDQYALEWAVRNVIKPVDTLVVLSVLPLRRRSPAGATLTSNFISGLLKKWSLGTGWKKEKHSSVHQEHKVNANWVDNSLRLENVLTCMVQQLCKSHNKKVSIQVKVLADPQLGSIAVKAKELKATWVVLDGHLKKEGDWCVSQLDCNIVVVDHTLPKVLRAVDTQAQKILNINARQCDPTVGRTLGPRPMSTSSNESATTRSSLGLESAVPDADPSHESSPEKAHVYDTYHPSNKSRTERPVPYLDSDYANKEVQAKLISSSPTSMKTRFGNFYRKKFTSPLHMKRKSFSGPIMVKKDAEKANDNQAALTAFVPARNSTNSLPKILRKIENTGHLDKVDARKDIVTNHDEKDLKLPQRISSIRMAMSVTMKQPPTPPPLCSICKNNVPVLGKSPKKFSYEEIKKATNGFSSNNLLTEGGYGRVYKGIMPDGQVVAVKQHKALSAQGAAEFCAEVEVLSCVRHRNLVMLIGYCIETEWLLVYEFACNGSLDKHLYGKATNEVMAWDYRMKVAIGAARGLRYLHEDCRVGCIVHRDFRPSNILLTHDFEPMVGDFGLARWQVDGELAEETRVIGELGYLAPEYTQAGLLTEKADVYAFGVVLLELLSGIKATEFLKQTGRQFALEWGRPLLEMGMLNEVLDPRLEKSYNKKEVDCMMYATNLCLSPDLKCRPRISKVLKILEGDIPIDLSHKPGSRVLCYPRQYLNNIYGGEILAIRRLDDIPFATPLHSRTEIAHGDTTYERSTPFNGQKVINGSQNLNQPEEFVSEEYKAYLHKSLAKFVGNLNHD